jgi:hypothetical protein
MKMIKKILNMLDVIIGWCLNLHHSAQDIFCKNKKSKLHSNILYYPLSPTDQIDGGQCYFDALNWALNNGKVKNIALTGPYGSGKSSILQSFQKQNTNKNLHFLNISLATFKEEKTNEEKTEGENLLRLIELSVLQQLFYKEENKRLPDSRLKKIKNFKRKETLILTGLFLLFLLSCTYLIKPEISAYLFPWYVLKKSILHIISLSICVFGCSYFIFKSIRIFHNLNITKLNVKDGEIEINKDINKSVLNHNLEEILYFFEATKYNVVIIEDLDRFEQTEIFTKLREINLLLNNSKNINRDIVFIYAIRDEMFQDKDRTKFFDFIIPVIPVINSSNSNEIFQKEIKQICDSVSDNLIDDISLFIDEMRLLYNILNEFQIYRKLLSEKLSQDKLLAMLVYKNICPCDFVKLSDYQGELYQIINNKTEYIKQQTARIDTEISKCKEEIKPLESLKIKEIKELRAVYVLQYITNSMQNITYGLSGFRKQNANISVQQLLEDSNFTDLSNNLYQGYNNAGYSCQLNAFSQIEQQVDTNLTYEERAKQIEDWNNGKVNALKQKIETLQQKKNEIRHEKLQNLIQAGTLPIEAKANQQKLINLLLRNGYISEDYLDYISLFHEGSISKNDHTFLLNVKSGIKTDFAHKLDKIDKLIEKIGINDFGKEYILNLSLVDFLLDNEQKYQQRIGNVFNLLSKEPDKFVDFIDEFAYKGNRIDLFIRYLYQYRINVFDLLYTNHRIYDSRLQQWAKLIIENAEIESLKTVSENSFFVASIINNRNKEYNLFEFGIEENKLKEFIKEFDLKFRLLSDYDLTNELFDFIYVNNHYIISTDNIRFIITNFFEKLTNETKPDLSSIDTQNYYAIQHSKCKHLIKYVDDNISEYVENVYLKLDSNTKEDEEHFIKLLNDENISDELKVKIIQKVETKISSLSKIDATEIEDLLLQYSKLLPNWADIVDRFVNDENTISVPVLVFLNNVENAKELSKSKIEQEKPDKKTIYGFLKALLLNDKINNNSYGYILGSIPYWYSSLEFETLTKEKISLLIKKKKLQLTKSNYDKLREEEFILHIDLIETVYYDLKEEILETLTFDNADIIAVLKSSIIPNGKKQMIFNAYDKAEIEKSTELLDLIAERVLQNSLSITKNLLTSILTKSKNTNRKIELFNKKINELDTDNITAFLQKLPEPYSNIAENGKRPFIEKSDINLQLAQNLKSKKYISKFEAETKGILNKEEGIRISTFKK